jgi:hypothetical protein
LRLWVREEKGGPLGFRIGLLYTRLASVPQALWAAPHEEGTRSSGPGT